jgi:protein phosphatase-4 regulatory subunit 3
MMLISQSVFARKEGPLADNFVTFFYETSALQLFKPITDLPQMDKESKPIRDTPSDA